MKTKNLLLAIVLMACSLAATAQNSEHKWGLGGYFGVMQYAGDYNNQFFRFKEGYAGGAAIARYLNPSFDLMLHFYYDGVDSHPGEDTHDQNTWAEWNWAWFRAHVFNLNLAARYKFNNGYIFKEDAFFAPYLLLGIGGNLANVYKGKSFEGTVVPPNQTFINPNLFGGLGFNFRLHPAVSLRLESTAFLPPSDKIDLWYPDAADNKFVDAFLENSVGLFITPGAFGGKKDTDGDGVPDKIDKCPDTPAGVKVDADGCPLDTDKDGIPDYQDDCPNVAGLKQFNGCPDTDGDGIPDKNDECPDVAGPALLKGCPDSDGDGVPDKDDRCPNTPKGYQVDRFGCPIDSDKDGIPDSEDACPQKPGVAELKGCPFDAQTIINKYQLSMGPILFDFDKSVLKPEGIESLNKLANALNNHQDFGVQLDGHADWVGSEEYNLKLSERRANSAKTYLNQKGIADQRIRIQFFGESKPAQDNRTKEGRRLNRRVEYSLFELNK
jgi:outer membrane protein OmpA-like peptidoglycan-associated protein